MSTPTYQLINQVPIQKEFAPMVQRYFQAAPLGKYIQIDHDYDLNGDTAFYMTSKVFAAYELTVIYNKLLANYTDANIKLVDLLKEQQASGSEPFGDNQVTVAQLLIPYEMLNSLKELLATVSTDLLRIETHVSAYGTRIYLLSDVFTHTTLSAILNGLESL